MPKSDMLYEALLHLAQGRIVFPAVNKKPKVKWKDLISEPPNAKKVIQWFADEDIHRGIAMITGAASGGIFAVSIQGRVKTSSSILNLYAPDSTVYIQGDKYAAAFYKYPSKTIVGSGCYKYIDANGYEVKIRVCAENAYIGIPPSYFARSDKLKWIEKGPDAWDNLPTWNPINFIKQFA